MRLLFDEHLSPKLVRRLQSEFPGSTHVQLLGQRGARDSTLWQICREHGFTLVTRDSDFQHMAMSLGPPPKVILVLVSEGRTDEIERLLRSHTVSLTRFETSAESLYLLR